MQNIQTPNPSAPLPLIALLSCGLFEVNGSINLMRDSFLYKIYGKETIEEGYHCRYGLNPQLEYLLEKSDLKAAGRDTQGEVRAMELKARVCRGEVSAGKGFTS